MKDGEVVDLESFKKASEEEQTRIREAIAELEIELGRVFQQVPLWQRESSRKLQRLKETITRSAVQALVEELLQKYEALDAVVTYLKSVQSDIVKNAEYFVKGHEQPDTFSLWRRRYAVNVLTDKRATSHAPVVYETNPTLQNLIGRIEHQTQAGTLVTDFTMIKPGALHRANGGYLVLDANRLLTQPLAWDAVKRALQTRQIQTESPDRLVGILNTVSLEPEPIPLDLKVVLVGDHHLYHLLCRHDSDFGELFKVAADFDDVTHRNRENTLLFARLVANVVRNDSLRPLRADAVARVVEDAARRASDAERLSVNMREADRVAQGIGLLGGTGSGRNSGGDPRSARDRRQDPATRPAPRADSGGDRTGNDPHRHLGPDGRPGEWAVGTGNERIRVWQSEPHHCACPSRQRERHRYRA